MARLRGQGLALALLSGLAGCGPSYSPDTYASSAAQQANKVEQGVIVGVRQIAISASGVVGAATGGAAGGIVGSQVGSGGISAALGAVGGTLVGGLVGTTVEHAQGDTTAWEYIVKETAKGELVSVTQKDEKPLAIGQKVLVIAGSQARVVPDYTVPPPPPPAPPVTAPAPAPVTATPLAPPPDMPTAPQAPPAPAASLPP